MNTVEGVFRILDRASPVLDRIERKAKSLDRTMERTGVRMDEFSAKTQRDMRVAEEGVDKFARATEKTSGKVSGSMTVMERSIASATSSAQRDIGQLQTQLVSLDAQQANPSIDIDTAGPLAQIALIRKELRSLSSEKINIGSTGKSAAASAAAAAMAPQQGGFFRRAFGWAKKTAADAAIRRAEQGIQGKVNSAITRIFTRGGKDEIDETAESVDRLTRKVAKSGGVFGSVGERIWSWTKILLAAGPALESVAAAGSAVIGSLGGATLGAGVGLTGLIGTATVGFGGFLGTLIPTISKLKESKTALDAYSKAIRTYGRDSAEAQKAQRLFERTGTQDARQILGIWGSTKRFWRKATRPGQEETTGLIKDLMQTGRQRFLPQFAGISNQSATAAREGNAAFLDTVDSPNLHRNLNILSNTFQDVSPEAGRVLGNAARLVSNIAAAARPQVLEFFEWFDKWMSGANQDTSNLDKLDRLFKGWTRDFKVWVNFFKQLSLLAMTFFGAGKRDGNNMINELSLSMRELRTEWQNDPRGLENWFDKQTDNFKKLVREIGALVAALGELVDMLSETIGPITDVSKAVREGLGGGLLGTVGSVATLAGGAMAIRGVGRGIGRAGAGALGRRLPGRMGEYFLRKAATGGGIAAGVGEVAAGAGAGAAASRGLPFAARFGGPAALAGVAAYNLTRSTRSTMNPVGPGGANSSVAEGFAPVVAREARNLASGVGLIPNQIVGDFGVSPTVAMGISPNRVDQLAGEMGPLNRIYGQKFGDAAAFGKAVDPSLRAMRTAGPKGADIIARNTLMWANAQRRNNPKLEDAYDDLVGHIKNRYSALGQHIAIVNGRIYTGSQQEWGNIRKAMTSNVAQAAAEVQRGFTSIQRQAIGSLMGMGFSHDAAAKIVRGTESGSAQTRSAAFGAAEKGPGSYEAGMITKGLAGPAQPRNARGDVKRASGGIIPGMGLQDTVNMGGARVAPGEAYIATRHHRREINDLLPYGVSMEQIISGNKRWHSSPYAGRYAGGGVLAAGRLASRMGLSVGEGPGFGGVPSGGHTSGSLHYSGLAYDISGAPDLMRQFFFAAQRSFRGQINELFYDPVGWYIDNGQKVPGAIGGHSDHVHIGFNPGSRLSAGNLGKLGVGGRGRVRLQAPQTRGRGIPGAMSQRAMDAYAGGLQQKLNRRAGLQMRGSRSAASAGTSGMSQIEQVLQSVGMPDPHLMAAIAMAESGGRAGVVNSIGAKGWFQIIPSTAEAFGLDYNRLDNPVYNSMGAKKILAGQGLGAWEAYTNGAYRQYMQSGGPIDFAGWMKDGGSFRVTRPTLFGAGEAGEEDVHVVPKGAKMSSSKSVRRTGPLVQIGTIEYRGKGDVRKAIEEEFAKLGVALENVVEDEDEVSS